MKECSSCSAWNGITSNRCLLIAALLLAPALAPAQDSPGRFEITPYAGYRFGGTFEEADGDREAELSDHASAGLILNLREGPSTQWELLYAHQSTEADVRAFDFGTPAIDVDLDILQIGGTYLGDGERARPYMAATIGGTRISPTLSDVDGDTFWSFSIGAGLQVFPAERIGLRLEARAFGTLLDSDTDLFCESGPAGGLCAVAIEGQMLWQFETFAGMVIRF